MQYACHHRDVTLRQMEYFVAVAECGSFSYAAQKLNVSQPGLSQQVQQLERELGTQLIERLPRTATLTDAGRAYLPEARLILEVDRRARVAVRDVVAGRAGDLGIATVTSVAAGAFARVVPRWQREYPNVNLRLFEYARRDILEGDVAAGTADVGVGPLPATWNGPILELGREEFVVVLPPDDVLGGQTAVELGDLSRRRWILFDADHGLSGVTEAACEAAGFSPECAFRVANIETAITLAAAGLGPVLIPYHFLSPGRDVAILRLKEPFYRMLAAYTRTAFTPISQAFLRMLDFSAP
jgi:DNA-binding transcriptional LysR family regulator